MGIKQSHGKLLQIKMLSSSASAVLSESLAVLKETKIDLFFCFFTFIMPVEDLEDFHEGLLFQ